MIARTLRKWSKAAKKKPGKNADRANTLPLSPEVAEQLRDFHSELSRLADYLQNEYEKEIRYRNRADGARVIAPMAEPLTIDSTREFFSAWETFGPALQSVSASLPRELPRMERAAKSLSSNLDDYDNGDRGPETYAAFLFMKKMDDARDMVRDHLLSQRLAGIEPSL